MLITLIFMPTADLAARGTNPLFLRSGWGIGYASMRDMGVSPLSYRGATLTPTLGICSEGKPWQWNINIQLVGNYLEDPVDPKFNFSTIEGIATVRFHAQRIILNRSLGKQILRLFAGASVDEWFEIHYDPLFRNSSTGMGNFIMPAFTLGSDWVIGAAAYRPDGRLMLNCDIAIAPVALVMRPGYAYIDNYSSAHRPNDATFDNYIWHHAGLPQIQTSTGVTLPLANGNRIGLTYQWSLTTTHNKGHHRFDSAIHLLQLTFDFMLSKKAQSISVPF